MLQTSTGSALGMSAEMPHSFHFLDDIATADLAFEVVGDSLQDLFQGATNALIETLADPETVGSTWRQVIERTDLDHAELLFDWLSDLVYWKDAAGVVFHDAALTVVHDGHIWNLTATLRGAPVDYRTQRLRNDVKGITKHLYHVKLDGTGWSARVVVDV